jgi:hypothetical protein
LLSGVVGPGEPLGGRRGTHHSALDSALRTSAHCRGTFFREAGMRQSWRWALRLGALGVTVFALSCAPAGGGQEIAARFESSAASVACSNHDGAAVRVVIRAGVDSSGASTEPGDLFVVIASYETVRRGLDRTFRVGSGAAGANSAAVLWCKAARACADAVDGWVRLERQTADSTVVGRFRFEFPDRRLLVGSFRAEWLRIWQTC